MEFDFGKVLNFIAAGKDSKEQEKRKEAALALYNEMNSKSNETLTPPKSIETRANDLNFNKLADDQMLERQRRLSQLRVGERKDIANVGDSSYGNRSGAYANSFVTMQAPALAEMAAGRKTFDDTHRYLIDKEYASRDQTNKLNEKILSQRNTGKIFDMITRLAGGLVIGLG